MTREREQADNELKKQMNKAKDELEQLRVRVMRKKAESLRASLTSTKTQF